MQIGDSVVVIKSFPETSSKRGPNIGWIGKLIHGGDGDDHLLVEFDGWNEGYMHGIDAHLPNRWWFKPDHIVVSEVEIAKRIIESYED